LDRDGRESLFAALFLFILPTALAIACLVIDRETIYYRHLVAVFLGVFCIGRGCVLIKSASVRNLSNAICVLSAAIVLLSGCIYLKLFFQPMITTVQQIIQRFEPDADGLTGRLTFYSICLATAAVAMLVPMIFEKSNRDQSVSCVGR
jgi:hypothetical protein